MASFFTDNDDLRFYFERGLDWDALVRTTEYEGRAPDRFPTTAEAVAFYTQVAEMVGELSADEIAPRAAQIDRKGTHLENGEIEESPEMRQVFARIREVDLHRLCLPRELGGLNAPILLYFANAEMMARADVSTMTHHSFHGGMALAMLFFSIREGTTTFDANEVKIASTRFAAEIEEIAKGDAWGCMDITEPDAGSDMAALRTKAELGDDGVWRVTGQKIFITSGHGKYHFVIARTEESDEKGDPFAGLRGLSMFLVKTYDDLPDGTRVRHATLDRVEEKLGHHGSVTASLQFDKTPAELIGKRGEGFAYMLVLMNNARLGVGFECIGLCEAAYRMASAYAAERRSMGKPIARHEMIADYLDEMRTDVQAIRALGMYGAFHEEMAQRGQMMLEVAPTLAEPPPNEEIDLGRKRIETHRRKSRRVTPLLKYLAAEKAVEMARRCIQIHGGVGYTQEYGAEKLLRDALVMPIYEGTSQIQSLMAMKDTLLGILRRPQAFIARIGQARIRSLSARDPLERRVARIQSLSLGAQQHLVTRTAAAKLRTLGDVPLTDWPKALRQEWDPKKDFSLAMLHAERLTKLLADEAIAEILFEQSKAHPERRELLERFLDRAEPRARAVHDELTTTGARLLATLSPTPLAEAAE